MSIETAPTETVLESRRGSAVVLTLNRPEARNALNGSLVRELGRRLRDADADPQISAVVLTGANPVFCAGADLKEIRPAGSVEASERVEGSMSIHEMLPRLSKPVIAAVNGHALAGGCGLALACDIVVASSEAEFGYPEVTRGLVAALVMVNLSRLVGRRKALELLLTGRRVKADEALEIGMISEVKPKNQVLESAVAWAERLGEHSPSAIALTKRLFYRVSEIPFEAALRQARDVNLLMRQSKDALAGAQAFFNGGDPNRKEE